MPTGTVIKIAIAALIVMLLDGCATTYVPISWDHREKVMQLSRSDKALSILFQRYDPQRETLRTGGTSFAEVMWPGQVQHHLGAYRKESRLIYRNLYREFSDTELRDLILHEFAHHIWFQYLSTPQRDHWVEHLLKNPSSVQDLVRSSYRNPGDYDSEDFAFTMQQLRPIDILELTRMNVVTEPEGEILLSLTKSAPRHAGAPRNERAQLGSQAPARPAQVERRDIEDADPP